MCSLQVLNTLGYNPGTLKDFETSDFGDADDLKNLVSCIISSGVLLLDTYYNLSQREVRKMDIISSL